MLLLPLLSVRYIFFLRKERIKGKKSRNPQHLVESLHCIQPPSLPGPQLSPSGQWGQPGWDKGLRHFSPSPRLLLFYGPVKDVLGTSSSFFIWWSVSSGLPCYPDCLEGCRCEAVGCLSHTVSLSLRSLTFGYLELSPTSPLENSIPL